MEKKKRKASSLISLMLAGIILACVIVILILEAALPETDPFANWAKENILDIKAVPELLKANYAVFLHCVILIAIVIAVSKLIRTVFRNMMKKSNRAKTVITLLDGIIKYGSAIALFFLVLNAFGVNTKAIWESVGVITLIIGLGAQSLIADIIAGVFIIFENEYEVGEIVSIDDFRGTVTEIGIRATKVTDAAGNIKIINNSDIKNVVNLSRELSLAVVDCEFGYDTPIEFVEKVIADNLEVLRERIPEIVEGPFYKGISYYGTSNIAVKLVAKCKEEDRYQVQRDLLREYRQVFLANGFDFSYEQFVVNAPEKKEFPMDSAIKEEVKDFIDKQKQASSGIEDQHKN